MDCAGIAFSTNDPPALLVTRRPASQPCLCIELRAVVIKKRTGRYERSIREMRFDKGIKIGEPLRDFQGVLTGMPQLINRAPSDASGGRGHA